MQRVKSIDGRFHGHIKDNEIQVLDIKSNNGVHFGKSHGNLLSIPTEMKPRRSILKNTEINYKISLLTANLDSLHNPLEKEEFINLWKENFSKGKDNAWEFLQVNYLLNYIYF